ncbi:hypothetical protein ACFL59_03755 [Planctomycetota bacterium]
MLALLLGYEVSQLRGAWRRGGAAELDRMVPEALERPLALTGKGYTATVKLEPLSVR